MYVMLSLSKQDIHFKIQKIINFDKPAYRRQAQFDNPLNLLKSFLQKQISK